jgi:hypothetical protein
MKRATPEGKKNYNLYMDIETYNDLSMLSRALMHRSVNETINTAMKAYIADNIKVLSDFKAFSAKQHA